MFAAPALMIMAVVALVLGAATGIRGPLRWGPTLAGLLIVTISWMDYRANRKRRSAHLILAALVTVPVLGMTMNGGLDAPASDLLYVLVLLTAWIHGPRGSAGAAVLASLFIVVVAISTELRWLPRPLPINSSLRACIDICFVWVMWAVAVRPHQRMREAMAVELVHLRDLANQEADRRVREIQANLLTHTFRKQEEERQAIAHDLSERIAQTLASVEWQIETVKGHHVGGDHTALERIAVHVKSTLSEVRSVSDRLHPRELEHLGLEPALTQLAARLQDESDLTPEVDPPITV